MLGYWNKKEETAKVIKDGWLHTGDIGEIDPEDGYLKITDRKKDIIVSAGGDNISPAKIENMITNALEIDQCMVYGDKKNYLVALIVPNKEFVKEKENWEMKDIDWPAELQQNTGTSWDFLWRDSGKKFNYEKE